MVRLALEYGHLADAALAALAIVQRINALLYQHLEDALVGRNDEGQAGALEHDLDCGIFGHRRLFTGYREREPFVRQWSQAAALTPALTAVNFSLSIGYQFRYFKLKVTCRQLAAIAEREEYSIYVSAR